MENFDKESKNLPHNYESYLGDNPAALEFKFGEKVYNFYTAENFDPQVNFGEDLKIREEDPTDKKIRDLSDESRIGHHNRMTKFNTIHNKEYYFEYMDFIKDYLESNDGEEILHYSEIDHLSQLSELSPRQAMLLSSNIMISLRHYDTENASKINLADKMSALQMLNELSKNPENPAGVCRNYTDAVVAIFEAIKISQNPETSRLKNTYCEHIGSNIDLTSNELNHAINVFKTYTDHGSAITFIDPTNDEMDIQTPFTIATGINALIGEEIDSSIEEIQKEKEEEGKELTEYQKAVREFMKSFNLNVISSTDNSESIFDYLMKMSEMTHELSKFDQKRSDEYSLQSQNFLAKAAIISKDLLKKEKITQEQFDQITYAASMAQDIDDEMKNRLKTILFD